MGKVIITCAVTGSMHTPTMSRFLPITPADIAEHAIAAAQAGAAVLHLHARDPQTGRPTPSAEVFMQFLPQIHAATDAVINISTGGAPGMSLDDRARAATSISPELASLNMGNLSIDLSALASRYDSFQHDWEEPFLRGSEDVVFKNTARDIRHLVGLLAPGGTKFEFECYDVGHIHNVARFADEGIIKPPFFIQSVLGLSGALAAHSDSLFFMRQTADRLFGKDYVWSVFGGGKHQMPTCTMGALMGSCVRVGLEDSLYISRGQLARTNAEQVLKIRRILGELGLDVATPAEARALLDLKGRDNINL